MGRTMRWTIYVLLVVTVYAFGLALFAYVQVKTGWGLSIEEARSVRPATGATAGLSVAASLLTAMFALLALRVARRLEERADEA